MDDKLKLINSSSNDKENCGRKRMAHECREEELIALAKGQKKVIQDMCKTMKALVRDSAKSIKKEEQDFDFKRKLYEHSQVLQ